MQRIRLLAVFTALGAILLLSTPLMASLDRGAIRGTVTDPQGAVVPDAAVVVTNIDTGVETRLVTNAAGFYLAPELVPGRYTVHIEASGFSPLEIKDVMVTAGTTVTADAQLKVGPTTQRVEVSAQAQLVETTSSNFTTMVGRTYMENIPLQGRDIQTLVQLVPGVIQSAGPSGATFGFNSQFGGFPDPLHLVGSAISANGGQAGANAWYLEGASNATVGAESVVVNPSPDAVAEFSFVDNGLAAEFGRTSGAVVNVVLKSGTNKLHGDVYAYNRNSYFSATNPFAQRDSSGKPYLQPAVNWNDFGGTLGGPIHIPGVYNGKNRTFFFASWDVSLLHQRQNRVLTVPLPAERNGDFTGDPRFAANCGPGYTATNCLYDPLTTTGPDEEGYYHREPFATPVIPAGRIDPLAKFYVDSFPNPNYLDPLQQGPDGCGNLCNNYIGDVGSSMTTHNASVKIDHTVSDRQKFFFAWLFNPSYYTNFKFPWDGPTAPTSVGVAGAQPYNTRNQLAEIGLTSTFTPTVVNELRFSFGRQNLVARPNLESVTHNKEVLQKVQGLNFLLSEPYQPVPTISFQQPIGWDNFSVFGPIQVQNGGLGQQAYTLSDNLTKVVGKHTLKFGMVFQRNNLWASSGAGYNIGFDNGWYSLTHDPYTGEGGDGLASFLLGYVGQGGASTGVIYAPWQTNDNWSFYGQDDFRLTPSLTLNLGLRWDVFGWIRERHNMLANYDLGAINPDAYYKGKMVYMGMPSHPDRNVFPANKTSFGPRIGFAWSPGGNKKTVIRGGYGIVFSNSLSGLFGQGNGVQSSPGSAQNASIPITDYSFMTPAFKLSDGAPTIDLPNLDYNRQQESQLVGVGSNIFGFIKGDRDPYVQQWSLFVQRELPGNMVLSAGYVGSHGLHLLGEEIRNLSTIPTKIQKEIRGHINDNVYPVHQPLSGIWDCGPNPHMGYQVTCSGWYAFARYPQWWSVQNLLSPDGYNRYHAFQFRLEKRYSQGLNFILAYTFSKNMVSEGLGALVGNTTGPTTVSNKGVGRIAWIPGAAGGGVADGSQHVWYGDPDNRAAYDALSPDDTPHVLNIASTYEFPFGKGKHFLNKSGVADAILGGWKLSQNWNFQSGVPMSFYSSVGNLLYGGWGTGTPNLIGDLSAGRSGKTKQQRAEQWYNPAALAPPFGTDPTLLYEYSWGVDPDGNPVDFNAIDAFWQFGNAGLRPPSGRIPGFWNADMSLAKDFHLSESKYLTFRWDVFNALNHQNLGVPNNVWCLPPYDDGSTDAVHQVGCQFGKITNTQTDPRAMQFSLKFVW
jgi:hypothetical protein